MSINRIIKVVLVGSIGIGKTSIVKRLSDNTFNPNEKSTIGIDFKIYESGPVKFHIWDTAGQERFKAVARSYYRGAHAILFVYDVTSKISFNDIGSWLKEVGEFSLAYLVANKVDRVTDRCVTEEEGAYYAEDHNMEYVETSAKNGNNIREIFDAMATTFMDDPFDSILLDTKHVGGSDVITLNPTSSGNGEPVVPNKKCC